MKTVVAFVPVLHAGYLNFFRKHSDARLFILAEELYGEFEHLTREIRALKPEEIQITVNALGIFLGGARVLTKDYLWDLNRVYSGRITAPDEDITRHFASKYLPDQEVEFESVFLRFDMPSSLTTRPPRPDKVISTSAFDALMIYTAEFAAQHSPDWWRQVGALAVRDEKVLFVAYNEHMPSEHSLYALGDPRGNFKPGEHLDVTCAHHAETGVICKAAAEGVALAGAHIYVSVFPCPRCAYSIVAAKFARVYYRGGYSSVDADATMKAHGVEIIHVA